MRKLTRDQIKERDDFVKSIASAGEELMEAIDEYNSKKKELFEAITEKLDALKEAVACADEFRENIHGDMDAFAGEKSDKWQESDRGQSYQNDFMEPWNESLTDLLEGELNLDEQDDLEMPDVDGLIETFENMPTDFADVCSV